MHIYGYILLQIDHKTYCDFDQGSHSCATPVQSTTMSLEERQKQQLRSRPVVVLKELYPIKTEPEISDPVDLPPYILNATLTQTGDEEYKWNFQYHMSVLKLDEVGAATSFPISVKKQYSIDDEASDPSFYLSSERRASRSKRKCRKIPQNTINEGPLHFSPIGVFRKYTTRSGRNVNMIVDEY